MKKIFLAMMVVVAIAIVGCDGPVHHVADVDPCPPENKEQIRTQQEDDRDSVPPGHHPENDDDDPYGGKYDPIWLH